MPKQVETCSLLDGKVSGYLTLTTDEDSFIHEHLSTLFHLARNQDRVLEIGCGDSTYTFSEAIGKDGILESIDIDQGRIDRVKNGVPDNVDFFCQDSLTFESQITYNIIFIDGLHTEDQVKQEIYKFLPMLAKNGYMIFHDTNNPAHTGVRSAVDNSVLKLKCYECTEWLNCNGLTVFKKL